MLFLADSTKGRDHLDTLTSRSNLAGAYESAGDRGRAIALLEQTVAGFERVLGSDQPVTVGWLNNLAGAYELTVELASVFR